MPAIMVGTSLDGKKQLVRPGTSNSLKELDIVWSDHQQLGMPAPGTDPGLRFRRRDDYAVELFREIQRDLGDLPRVNRALLELGRFYNPMVNGPIVDLPTRRRILELLEAAREDEARQILDQRLALYARLDDGGSGGREE